MLFELFVCTIYHANQKSGRYVLRYDNSVKKMFQHKKSIIIIPHPRKRAWLHT